MDRTKSALDRNRADESTHGDLTPDSASISRPDGRSCDSLTGLCDWHAFHDCIRNAAISATENGRPLSLLILSVEQLEDLTESDAAWQGALRRIADLLADTDQHGSCAARQGAANFALVLPDTTLADATSLADHIHGRLLPGLIEYAAAADESLKIGTAQYDPQEPLGHFIQRAIDASTS